jgi:hypothetical protein
MSTTEPFDFEYPSGSLKTGKPLKKSSLRERVEKKPNMRRVA